MTTRIDLNPYGLGGVGETARWMAAARARESRRPDRLFDDPFAARLAGPDGASLLTYFHPRHANDNGNPYLSIRTRWFDDFLTAAVTPGVQVVGLGAGLDTRAYRLNWPDGIVLFEVDQPAVLGYKAERLQDCTEHCDRRVVAADLAGEWATALTDAGFDPSRPSVWFAEGVLFYLPEPLADRVLRDTARLATPESRIAADLIGTGIFRFRYMREFLSRLAEADSPWQFGTDDPAGFLRSCGWSDVAVTEPGHRGSSYGRWPEASSPTVLPNLPRIYLVSGRAA
jgi:methyltransferase (TIGR00027 family)